LQNAQSTNRPSVILYDRGLLDVAAYLPPDKWEAVLNHNQWLRDGFLGVIERYDLILHLVTAADGAESYFHSAKRVSALSWLVCMLCILIENFVRSLVGSIKLVCFHFAE
jgi:hypothetical protein